MVAHLLEEETHWLTEMVHILSFDRLALELIVDVLEVGTAEHRKEEVEVHHRDGDVGS